MKIFLTEDCTWCTVFVPLTDCRLCQYPWVSAEMASAIVQVHGSPKQLLDAYTQARNVSEAEMFLQDIMIRRGAGLVATQRRVGPEASRKIYAAITAVDGELIIGKKD